MTYCFAFKSSPDGLGIICDTRITTINKLGELSVVSESVQKVFNPTSNSFITVAGKIGHLKTILSGISDILESTTPNLRYDAFFTTMKSRYSELIQQEYFRADTPPEAQMIYGDFRQHRGRKICKLLRLEFGFRGERPAIKAGWGKDLEWAAIGWTQEGRKLLNNAAAPALNELYGRRGELFVQGKGNYTLNTKGPRDSTFIKAARALCNQIAENNPDIKVNPVMFLGKQAREAIANKMDYAREKNMEYHEAVGNS